MRQVTLAGVILTCVSFAAFAQSPSREVLDKLGALPKSKQQIDLDTMRIVMIERTMAASAEEQRSGLWQAWRVAVCNGCGIGNQRTVAEINTAADAYARPGDEKMLSRSRAQSSKFTQPTRGRYRSTQRIALSYFVAARVVRTAAKP